ncbi:hypothetical protein SVIO_096370 [Streptomyces violaceusniger]|uniref:Uncharacterized protein n=1 Tax=Streptomyces violaceusniger TaxID=68280 RepID=A0A4D4LF75_STRVO|nr:hypothetical protein SVIO_096370 [Streptomyces violaceusniger]
MYRGHSGTALAGADSEGAAPSSRTPAWAAHPAAVTAAHAATTAGRRPRGSLRRGRRRAVREPVGSERMAVSAY